MKRFLIGYLLLCAGFLGVARAQPLYSGLGLVVARSSEFQGYMIRRVIPGSDAEVQGVREGSHLLKLDTAEARLFDLEGVREALDVPRGAKQELTWGNTEESHTVALTSKATRGRPLAGDCLSGDGVLLGTDGGVYRGRFLDGTLEGFGRVDYGEEDWYEGEFQRGRFSGKGVRRQKGVTLTAVWLDGQPVEGPGKRETSESVFVGTGDWREDFRGAGVATETAQHYEIEGSFAGGTTIWAVKGPARIRNLDTGNVFEGRFSKAEIQGEGTFELKGAAPVAFAPNSFGQLLSALASPSGVDAVKPKPLANEVWGIEQVPDDPAAIARAKPATSLTPRKSSPTVCSGCGGCGFEWERCGYCKGSGRVEKVYTWYHRKEGWSYQRSQYDATGRIAGQETVRDVTTNTEQKVVEALCSLCNGHGGRETTRRCRTCEGRGVVKQDQ